MKKFIKWKILIITCAVCLLPVIAGIILWDKLPENIAIHFDINGNPDNYASKGFTVFGLPFLMVILQTICCLINDINAKKFGERKKFSTVTKWIVPIMSILLQGLTLAYALGVSVDIRRCVMLIVAGVFIAIGNYLPKFDRINDIKGHQISGNKARRVNRFIGFESVVMGILAAITVFLPPISSVVWLFLLIPYAIISIFYGVKVAKR